MNRSHLIVSVLAVAVAISALSCKLVEASARDNCKSNRCKRMDSDTGTMLHSHLSRKVFDRACSASKDVIDEIVACLTSNEVLMKSLDPTVAANCYKDSFGQSFDAKDIHKHKELICNNRDKFETLTTCVYRKTSEAMNKQQMDKVTEALVDVGLCIINALDG